VGKPEKYGVKISENEEGEKKPEAGIGELPDLKLLKQQGSERLRVKKKR